MPHAWLPSSRHIRQLYDGLVNSLLLYGSGTWMCYLDHGSLDQIDALQADAARLILGVPSNPESKTVMYDSLLLPAHIYRGREAAILYCRALERNDPDDLLLRVARRGAATWIHIGVSVAFRVRVNPNSMEAEYFAHIDEDTDIRSDINSGRLEIITDEATPAIVQSYHSSNADIYYTDGLERKTCGAVSYVRFRGDRDVEDCPLAYLPGPASVRSRDSETC